MTCGRLPGVNPRDAALAKPTLCVLSSRHAFHPSLFPWAGGQRTGNRAAAGTDNDQVLTSSTRSFSWGLLSLPADPPAPRTRTTAPGSCARRLQPEIWCTVRVFPRVVYSSHSFQQEGEKKSSIQSKKRMCINQQPSKFS